MTHATATLLLLLVGAVAHVDAYSCSTSADCDYPGCSDVLVSALEEHTAGELYDVFCSEDCYYGRGAPYYKMSEDPCPDPPAGWVETTPTPTPPPSTPTPTEVFACSSKDDCMYPGCNDVPSLETPGVFDDVYCHTSGTPVCYHGEGAPFNDYSYNRRTECPPASSDASLSATPAVSTPGPAWGTHPRWGEDPSVASCALPATWKEIADRYTLPGAPRLY